MSTPSPAPAASPAPTVTVVPARPTWWHSSRNRALLLIGILVLGVVFLFGGDGWVSVLDATMIWAIAALGLNVLSGYAGQISLGIAFFMGIGAYTAGWLGGGPPLFPGDPNGLGLSFLIWLPVSGLVSALIGALVGPTALRLKGFYLGIVTLALVFIGQYLFLNLRSVTGGAQGRSNFPTPSFGDFSFASPTTVLGVDLTTNQWYFLLLLPLLVIAAIFVGNVARTRVGRAWQAVRDNEVAASIMGVNLFAAKMGAFILSSFLAGIAGALYASLSGIATPGTWNLLLSVQLIAAILIGGAASVWGSILGAAFVFALPIALDSLSLLPQSASSTGLSSGDLNAILYGLLIIVFLLYEPAGMIGLIHRLRTTTRRFEARRKGGDPATQTMASSDNESQLDVEPVDRAERTDMPQAPD
jgi:branched-chain amino acid transport system permease protein